MQRLFFHNKYDINSVNQLQILEQNIVIYDVFNIKTNQLPQNINLTNLPYLIDKQITLETLAPYYTGTILLRFQCRDYLNNIITDSLSFAIYINELKYDTKSIDGIIELEIVCNQPRILNIKIINESDGYYHYEADIEVVNSA